MKKTLTIIIMAFIASGSYAQRHKEKPTQSYRWKKDTVRRYWLYEASFKVDSGCSNVCHGTFTKLNGAPANFDDVKHFVEGYVSPFKLIQLTVNSITEITKDQLMAKSDTFKCIPYHPPVFKFDTLATGLTVNPRLFYSTAPYTGLTFDIHGDTIPVRAYCLVNKKRGKFKWKKLYAVTGSTSIIINYIKELPLAHYGEYLMPDRKTKSIYQVLISINQ